MMKAKQKKKQKRVGPNEQKLINRLVKKIKKYRILISMKNQREVKFNDRLKDYLTQIPNRLNVKSKKIPVATFVGEKFIPDFYLAHNKRLICAVECKRLMDEKAKGSWKAGLAQALLYSDVYKFVILVLFDFTKDRRYYKAFRQKKSSEKRFANELLKTRNILLLVLEAKTDKTE